MAEDDTERSEDPTQKRLDDALEKGDVVKSQEVNTWFIIAGATLVLTTFSGSLGAGILAPMRNLVEALILATTSTLKVNFNGVRVFLG